VGNGSAAVSVDEADFGEFTVFARTAIDVESDVVGFGFGAPVQSDPVHMRVCSKGRKFNRERKV
jgi:hypothetical protein